MQKVPADRWLPLLATAAGVIGFFGPWIPHKAVALIVTGFELSEFAKFFPEVQTRSVVVVRPLFLLPLPVSGLIISLWIQSTVRRRAPRVASAAVGGVLSLAALPPYEALADSGYRGQVALALGGFVLALLAPLANRWRACTRLSLVGGLAAVGLVGPVSQYARLHPLVERLYNQPVGVGWGLTVCALGFGFVAVWSAIRAARLAQRDARDGPGLAALLRKGVPVEPSSRIVFYGTAWCPDCRMARGVLDRKGVDYKDIDIDADPTAAAYVSQLNRGFRSVPTIVFPDGSVLVEPTRSELREKLASAGGGE